MEHPYKITSLGKLERKLPGFMNAQALKQALQTLVKYAAILEANKPLPQTAAAAAVSKLVTSVANSPISPTLASAMSAPISRSLDYQGIARKCIQVDPLPQGALPTYDNPFYDCFKNDHYQITNRGKLTTKSSGGVGRVIFPTFTTFQSPSVKIGDVKKRRFSIIDRAVQKARFQILNQEDANIFAALDAASGVGSIVTVDAAPIVTEKKARKRKKKRNRRRNKLA
jgi:hypothetical protein